MKNTKKEKTSKQVNHPKALTAEQAKAAAEHALKLKVEKEQKELEEIKKLHLTGHQAQELLRAIKEDESKPEPKKEKAQPKPEAKKEPKPETMAEYLDKLVATGGTWEELVKAAQAEAEKKGQKSKLSRGTIQGHISYRVKKEADWLKERNLTVADEGIAVKK